jgi:polyhydroxyalkanoate synthesis regulator phasin
MSTRVRIASLAGEIEIPSTLFADRRTRQFVDTLVERGGIERHQAWRYAAEILALSAAEFAERLGKKFGAHMARLVELRGQAKHKYDAVVEHLSRSAAPLPADLQPDAFRRLFAEMDAEMQRLTEVQPKEFVPKVPAGEVGIPKDAIKSERPPKGVVRPRAEPPAVKLTGEAEALDYELRYFSARFAERLELHPRGAEIGAQIQGVRALIAAGRLDEARPLVDALKRDLHLVDAYLADIAPPGSGAMGRREAAAGEGIQPRQTPVQNIEGLRTPPPRLPPDAPELPVEQVDVVPWTPGGPGAAAEQRRILTSGEKPSTIGNEYEAFIKRQVEADPSVVRPGRRPDIGDWEITISGQIGPFTNPHKWQQFWLDLMDRRGINLIVPVLSPEAARQLRQLAAHAEALLGERVYIQVIETMR